MLSLDQSALADIAAKVIAQLGSTPAANPTTRPGGNPSNPPAATSPSPPAPSTSPAAEKPCHCQGQNPADGVFGCVDGAVAAARDAFDQLERGGFELREKVCAIVKTLATSNAEAWGQFEFAETKIGRLEHKADKLRLVEKVPGVEWLRRPTAMGGDAGLTLEVLAPYGVVAGILPVTHSVPTLAGNVVNMIAAGNAVVFNPHPGGAKSAAMAVRAFNQAIQAQTGIRNLICTIEEPSLESFNDLVASPGVDLLAITGGPAVVAAAMKSGKRAICAGPGNPPVIVDESADLAKAAHEVMAGASFDNNLLCIGEKQVFVTAGAWEGFLSALRQEGAAELTSAQLEKLTAEAFTDSKDAGGCSHPVLNRALVGADASKLAALAGAQVPEKTPLLFAATHAQQAFVIEEQMMPMLPVVRCESFEEALAAAKVSEHGYKHSAIIHSASLERISTAARTLNTTVLVANGPSTAGLGLGAEGYLSYSIATTTGEGITTPATFCRTRRVTMAGGLRVIGA